MAPLLAIAGRFDDVWTPVLVKEVRQALRGRVFLIVFLLALLLALIVTFGWSTGGNAQEQGDVLAMYIVGCLSLPLLVLVPFSAFTSVTSEREDGALELLQLSPLSPLQLVLGKLLAAGVQAMLFFAAFVPFLCLSFITRGVGLFLILGVLAFLAGASFFLTAWALALGSVGTTRIVRVLMLIVLGFLSFFHLRLPFSMEFGVGAGASMSGIFEISLLMHFIPGLFGLGAAAARLAHPTANTSTPLRVLTTASVFVAFGLTLWVALDNGLRKEHYSNVLAGVMLGLAVPCAFFVTEPDPLPRGIARRGWSGSRWHSWLWLPGGGRGLFFLWTHQLALLVAGAVVVSNLPGGRGLDGFAAPVGAALLVTAYLVIPSTAFAARADDPRWRTAVRWAIPGIVAIGILVPPFLAFLVGESGVDLSHALNPFWVIFSELGEGGALGHAIFDEGAGWWAVFLGTVGAFVALPRLVRTVEEIRRLRSAPDTGLRGRTRS